MAIRKFNCGRKNQMSKIIENIKGELLKRCKTYHEKYSYDFWNDHIKYVVKNSVELAKKYDADVLAKGVILYECRIY